MPFWRRPEPQPPASTRRQGKRMERARRKAQRRFRRRLMRWGFAAGAFVVGLAVVVSLLLTSLPRSRAPAATPGQTPLPGPTPTPPPILTPVATTTAPSELRRPPSQGAAHINPEDPHPPYNTTPPTSGWHWPYADSWGIKTTPREDELLVHNLEHGGVIASYDRELLTPEQVKALEDIFRRQREFPCYLIVTPYPRPIVDQQTGLRYPLALTAWTAIQYLANVDEEAIQKFIDQFRNRGPERVACTP
ncbi:hypothetical protein HRbin23_01013 [bacterium HR23]|nr:hypothetical protein HRbin23_01013 [bacterium HR23]